MTIVCRIDLNDSSEDGAGGWIPMWLYVKTIGATGVRSVMNMRKALLDDQKRIGQVPENSATRATEDPAEATSKATRSSSSWMPAWLKSGPLRPSTMATDAS